MKRNMKWITYIITGSLLAGLLAACGHRHHSPEERADWMVEKATDKLALNDTQVARLNALKDVVLAAQQDFRKRRAADRDTISALIAKPTLDRQQALGLVNDHTAAVDAEAPKVIAALGDFYDSLNPEQQATLREFVSERMEHGRRYWH